MNISISIAKDLLDNICIKKAWKPCMPTLSLRRFLVTDLISADRNGRNKKTSKLFTSNKEVYVSFHKYMMLNTSI
jgi:hypothetical protein